MIGGDELSGGASEAGIGGLDVRMNARYHPLPLTLVLVHSLLVVAVWLFIRHAIATSTSPEAGEVGMLWGLFIVPDLPLSLVAFPMSALMGPEPEDSASPGWAIMFLLIGGVQWYVNGRLVLAAMEWRRRSKR
jgi:hypothetical protein